MCKRANVAAWLRGCVGCVRVSVHASAAACKPARLRVRAHTSETHQIVGLDLEIAYVFVILVVSPVGLVPEATLDLLGDAYLRQAVYRDTQTDKDRQTHTQTHTQTERKSARVCGPGRVRECI